MADEVASAPYRVAQPQRLLLAGEARAPGRRQVALQFLQGCVLAARLERCLKFELTIKMILDDALVAAGDKNEMLDSGFTRFVDGVLDQRPVDDRKHLFRHRFCGWEKAGSEPRHRENCSPDAIVQYGLL
jgi:hypothetical protein